MQTLITQIDTFFGGNTSAILTYVNTSSNLPKFIDPVVGGWVAVLTPQNIIQNLSTAQQQAATGQQG